LLDFILDIFEEITNLSVLKIEPPKPKKGSGGFEMDM